MWNVNAINVAWILLQGIWSVFQALLYNKTHADALAPLRENLKHISILQNSCNTTSASHKFTMNGLQLTQLLVRVRVKFALETLFNNQELKV